MDDQNKNLILATALSFLVILVWFYIFPPEDILPPVVEQTQSATGTSQTGDGVVTPPKAGGASAVAVAPPVAITNVETRDAAIASSARVTIKTDRVEGSLSLIGGRIDDLHLLDYNVRLNDSSVKVTLLSPAGGPNAYYTSYGWQPAGDLEFAQVPGATTPWQVVSGSVLTQTTPITLQWDNGSGLIFHRTISIDDNYLFSITQSVKNNTSAEVAMAAYGIIARTGEPDVEGFFISHEGVVRYNGDDFEGDKLEEINYDDLPDLPFVAAEAGNVDKIKGVNGGWTGFADKYWMTTLIPAGNQTFTSLVKYSQQIDSYQTEVRLPLSKIASGASYEVTTSLFAGAKEWETLRDYQDTQGVTHFIESIDWGWFSVITKPMFRLLNFLNHFIGNMGWSILALTLVIKAMLFPLAYKSYVSMARMKELQPEMEKLKEQCGDDRQRLQKEMMALYKKKKANPAAGCLPIILQIPIFFSLYKVIFVTIGLRHAPFIAWVKDLSAPDPTSLLNLFGLLPFSPPGPESFLAILSIGVLPILMGITMWMQQKLNPAPTDATQKMIFAWMPWVFMFMLGRFASGLVLYWVANNTITFTQQYLIMRSQGVKPDVFGNIRESLGKLGKKSEK